MLKVISQNEIKAIYFRTLEHSAIQNLLFSKISKISYNMTLNNLYEIIIEKCNFKLKFYLILKLNKLPFIQSKINKEGHPSTNINYYDKLKLLKVGT